MLFRDSDTQRRDTSYDNLSNIDIQYNFSRFSFLTIKIINDKVIHLGTSQESRDARGLVLYEPSKCPAQISRKQFFGALIKILVFKSGIFASI